MPETSELELLRLRIEALQERARKLHDEHRDTRAYLARIAELMEQKRALERANVSPGR